jgi:hypothetical protein
VSDETGWYEQRRASINAHAAALHRQRAAETAEARRLLAGFVRELTDRGVPPVRLRARVPDRRTTYRTGLTGWYLRRDGSLAVSVDGDFYLLETAGSPRSRLTGVRLPPTDPPLRIGAGARDGESVPLARLLEQAMARYLSPYRS